MHEASNTEARDPAHIFLLLRDLADRSLGAFMRHCVVLGPSSFTVMLAISLPEENFSLLQSPWHLALKDKEDLKATTIMRQSQDPKRIRGSLIPAASRT